MGPCTSWSDMNVGGRCSTDQIGSHRGERIGSLQSHGLSVNSARERHEIKISHLSCELSNVAFDRPILTSGIARREQFLTYLGAIVHQLT